MVILSFQVTIKFSSPDFKINLKDYFQKYLKELYGLNFSGEGNDNASTITLKIDKSFMSDDPEAYSLKIKPSEISIVSSSERGLFYGIQTIFQILPKGNLNGERPQIQCCEITDFPKFKWRGLNLDCARHFMSKEFVKRYIDILAYYKFNTFHWHLTDDQGWRIEIKKYPKLTQVGAWRKEADGSIYGGYYTQDDIKDIVAYAKSRFINIVPEIEMPGHCTASLAAYPENSCTGGPFEVPITWGVFNDIYCAGRDSTFTFLENVLDEVISLFPGKYIHIGGDEVPKIRWKSCPLCQARIKAEGLKNEEELQSYFIKRISKYLASKGKDIIGWDEILEGGLAPGAIVQSWRGFEGAEAAANLGHSVICSPTSHTYFDSDPEGLDLRVVYSFNPIPTDLPDSEKKYILGSEANMWSERAPMEVVDQRLFPRMLALSEVLWTAPADRDFDEFHKRVENAYADLDARGIKYGPETKAMTFYTTYNKDEKQYDVKIIPGQQDLQIRYSENGEDADSNSTLYTAPIAVSKSEKLSIAAYRENKFIGKRVSLSFVFHKALNAKVTLLDQYDERYRGGGEQGIVDGIRGTTNLHDGLWQGYEGKDFECIIDLGSEKEISNVSPRFLLNSSSWVFLPSEVIVSLSKDGKNYDNEKTVVNDVSQKNPDVVLKDFTAEYDSIKARYIKVHAVNIKVCPPWHPGAGGKAWLFVDEIVVE